MVSGHAVDPPGIPPVASEIMGSLCYTLSPCKKMTSSLFLNGGKSQGWTSGAKETGNNFTFIKVPASTKERLDSFLCSPDRGNRERCWHPQAEKRPQSAASTLAGVLVVSCPSSARSLLTVLPSFLTLLPYSLLYTVSRFIF